MIEILGTIASCVVLVSFLCKNAKHIRMVNILGALLFVVYGAILGAFSVWFLNGALVIVHVYNLYKMRNE